MHGTSQATTRLQKYSRLDTETRQHDSSRAQDQEAAGTAVGHCRSKPGEEVARGRRRRWNQCSIELNEVEEPEGDSNTRCWRVRWTRPSIVARPKAKQAPYAKSSSSSEEAARANCRPRRKCEAPIIEQYAATRPQHEGSTKLYALLSYPCCSTTERPATENVAASPTAAISSRTQAGRSRDRGLDRKAGQLAITFAELHSTRRWAG